MYYYAFFIVLVPVVGNIESALAHYDSNLENSNSMNLSFDSIVFSTLLVLLLSFFNCVLPTTEGNGKVLFFTTVFILCYYLYITSIWSESPFQIFFFLGILFLYYFPFIVMFWYFLFSCMIFLVLSLLFVNEKNNTWFNGFVFYFCLLSLTVLIFNYVLLLEYIFTNEHVLSLSVDHTKCSVGFAFGEPLSKDNCLYFSFNNLHDLSSTLILSNLQWYTPDIYTYYLWLLILNQTIFTYIGLNPYLFLNNY